MFDLNHAHLKTKKLSLRQARVHCMRVILNTKPANMVLAGFVLMLDSSQPLDD